jgi:hypothetical protein
MRIPLVIASVVLGLSQLLSAQSPVLTSITPNYFSQPVFPVVNTTTATLTIKGSHFKSGMKVIFGTHIFSAKLVNQYAGTVTVDTSLLNFAGDYQVAVKNPNGFQSGTVRFQICSPITILTTAVAVDATTGEWSKVDMPPATGTYTCN